MIDDVRLFIMAGGIGSRFWPKSRIKYPKQFVDILGVNKSLLQMTAERFIPIIKWEKVHVLTNLDYEKLVKQQLVELPSKNVICEPSRNNTAPCIAYAAFKLYKENPNAVMVIVPSDHLILKEELYISKIQEAIEFAKENDVLVTLGILPTRPDTGYGYIQYQKSHEELLVKKVLSFKEKPNYLTAVDYLKRDEFLWNAGMFIWKVSSIIESFKKYSPDLFQLFKDGEDFYNSPEEIRYINKMYPKSPDISIDFAILEKAENVVTIPADIGWSDLGTWNSLHDMHTDKDANNNALIGNSFLLNNTNSCIINMPFSKLVVIDGLKDYIIVDDKDVLLIYPRCKEQQIKDLTSKLKDNDLDIYL